jgi:hypothetical protein
MLAAIGRCAGLGVRGVVLIGPDPGLAFEIGRLHPESIVQSFAPNATPDETLVRRGRFAAVDLVVVVDVPTAGFNKRPLAQQIGERRVLLRLSGDRRPIEMNYNEIVYFGGLGTRFCYKLWNWGRHVFLVRRPRMLLGQIARRLVLIVLLPFIYAATALAGLAMNITGILLDAFSKDESSSHRDNKSMSLEPSI